MSQPRMTGVRILGATINDLARGEASGDITELERKHLYGFRALSRFLRFHFGYELPDADADKGLMYLVLSQTGASSPWSYARSTPDSHSRGRC